MSIGSKIRAIRIFGNKNNGTAAPELDSNAPNLMVLEDWSTGAAVTVGSITMDTRMSDWVFQDTDIFNEFGNIRVTQCSTDITLGAAGKAFAFAATLFSMRGKTNADANATWHQVLVACKPVGRWSGYPNKSTYASATDTTVPTPFKITIRKADGTLLTTFQMRDGKAINDTTLLQSQVAATAYRPWWNCGMLLEWHSATPKINSRASHYYPGLTSDSVRPSQAKQQYTANGAPPYDQSQYDGYNQMYVTPQWPAGFNTPATVGPDDYLAYTPFNGDHSSTSGWDWEPGSVSGHDWYTGPGGPRFDRNPVPSILALYATNRSGSILATGVPYLTVCNAYMKAYFNHPVHYITNVKTLATLTDSACMAGQWAYYDSYYNDLTDIQPPDHGIHLHLTQDITDSTGKKTWNGWALDWLHSYTAPGWGMLYFNSPAHAFAAKLRFNAEWIASLGYSPADMNGLWMEADNESYMSRIHAWRWMHYTHMWKLASNHTLGHSRASVESRWVDEMEALYQQVYVPAMVVPVNTGKPYAGLRNLGIPIDSTNTVSANSLCFYMAQVIALMKQTGAWAAMYAKGGHTVTTMDFLMRNLILYSCDYIIESHGFKESTDPTYENVGTPVPADWSAYAVSHPPGAATWFKDAGGTAIERDATCHLRAQMAFVIRDFFPEYSTNRVTSACSLYSTYYADWASAVAAQSTHLSATNRDFSFRVPCHGIISAPDAVG